jgi:hypothetical protein
MSPVEVAAGPTDEAEGASALGEASFRTHWIGVKIKCTHVYTRTPAYPHMHAHVCTEHPHINTCVHTNMLWAHIHTCM